MLTIYTPFVRTQWHTTFQSNEEQYTQPTCEDARRPLRELWLYDDLADPSLRSGYTVSMQLGNGASARRGPLFIELADFKDN
jgi:hypothetical protein